jgi:hypothetical protein
LGPEFKLPKDDLHLLLDVELAAQEVDVADAKAEHLALTEPAASGDDTERPLPLGEGVVDCLHLLDGPRFDLARLPLGQLHRACAARVEGDEPIVDRGVEHRGDVGEHGPRSH